MKRVFVDTGGFFAHVFPADPEHDRAKGLFLRARTERWRLITTNAVIAETHALLVNKLTNGIAIGTGFLRSFDHGLCRVDRVTHADEREALRFLERNPARPYSLCDAMSFTVMRRLHVSHVIAFDRHFLERYKLP